MARALILALIGSGFLFACGGSDGASGDGGTTGATGGVSSGGTGGIGTGASSSGGTIDGGGTTASGGAAGTSSGGGTGTGGCSGSYCPPTQPAQGSPCPTDPCAYPNSSGGGAAIMLICNYACAPPDPTQYASSCTPGNTWKLPPQCTDGG